MVLLLTLPVRPAVTLLGSVSCTKTVEAGFQSFNLSDAVINREGFKFLTPCEYVI